jgi:hypothetical protein
VNISDIPVPLAGARLVDLDLRDGVSAAILDRNGIQQLLLGQWATDLPRRLRFPIVRLIDATTALVLDTRTAGEQNAWIIRSGTGITAHFLAGDAVGDVVILAGVVAVTYFDEGIYGHTPPSPEGIAIFSTDGVLLWGYHSTLGKAAATIDDCYCASAGPDGRLWFHPYSDFPLVALHCRTKTQDIFPLPVALRGSKALSTDGSRHWLFSPSPHKSTLFSWTPGALEPTPIGTFDGRLRGLCGGRFLNVTDTRARLVQVAA